MKNTKDIRQPTREDLFGFYQEATDQDQEMAPDEAVQKEPSSGRTLPRREDLFGVTVTLVDSPDKHSDTPPVK